MAAARGTDPFSFWAAVARAAGVTLDWLATGNDRPINADLLGRVLSRYRAMLRASGRQLPKDPRREAQVIAAVYNVLATSYSGEMTPAAEKKAAELLLALEGSEGSDV